MKRGARVTLEQADELVRDGDLPEAQKVYEKLLAGSPGNPSVLGRLAAIARQQGRVKKARSLLRRAMAAGGTPGTRIRNLRTYLLLMREQGLSTEAGRLAATGVATWPPDVRPTPADRAVLLSVADMLSALGHPGIGLKLLADAFPDPSNDAELLVALGRLHLELDESASAVDLLQRAVRSAPNSPAPLIALSAALERSGQREMARRAVHLIARRFPYVRGRRRETQTATILVLNPPPASVKDPRASIKNLHFQFNFPSEFPERMADRYRFLSVLGTIPDELRPWEEDMPGLVLNNLVNEEGLARPGAVDWVRALIDRIGVACINPPEAVVQVTREKNVQTLEGIAGLKVPRTARYPLNESNIDTIVAQIGQDIGYPVILRHPSAHSTAQSLLGTYPKTVHLVQDARSAHEALSRSGWPSVFAIEFIELRRREGWYRKFRAVYVGEAVTIFRGGCYSEWIVNGWFNKPWGIEFYRANPGAVDHLRAVLSNPRSELGAGCLETLKEVGRRIPLDIFGVDFDVDDAGRVVFFEASPGMVISHPRKGVPRDLWLPMEPFERIHAAFHDLVEHRLAESP